MGVSCRGRFRYCEEGGGAGHERNPEPEPQDREGPDGPREGPRFVAVGVDASYYVLDTVTYHSDIKSAPEILRDYRRSIDLGLGAILPLGLQKRSCYEYEDEWRAVI